MIDRTHDGLLIPGAGLQHRYVTLAVCGLLLLAVGLVFCQTARFEFVNVDDNRAVYANSHVTAGLTVAGIVWTFTHQSCVSGWGPLTALSHAAVWQCCGSNAGGHHLVNVLLHAASAVILFLVLRSMTGRFWPSALVAALFAIHPLQVESVAWVTERKGVLSGLFFILTLGAYVGYVRHPRSLARYATVMVLFVLGLMSKSMVATLPAVLLLLDYWPLGRFADRSDRDSTPPPGNGEAFPAASFRQALLQRLRSWGPLLLEKIPFLPLAAFFLFQSVSYEMTIESPFFEDQEPLAWRLGTALVSYPTYLWRTVCPVGLIPPQPPTGADLPLWEIIAAAVLVSCISFAVLALWRRCPYLLVGWLWYLGMLLPVSGVVEFGGGVQVGADRYTYLPQIGLYLAFAWVVADACRCWSWRRWVCGGTSALALAILMGCAWRQTTFWRDSETLWTHTLSCFPRHKLAHHFLGVELCRQGRVEEGMQHFRDAWEMNPHSSVRNYNLGLSLAKLGRFDEAMLYYRRSLAIQPQSAVVHCALATALAVQGRLGEALANYRKALELEPDNALAHEGISGVLIAQGRPGEALPHCQRALEFQPNLAMAHNNLGNILARRGQLDEALAHYQRALEIQPNLAAAYTNIGDVLAARGQFPEALGHYRRAIEIQPNDPMAERSLAWLRATCPEASLRNSDEAMALGPAGEPAL